MDHKYKMKHKTSVSAREEWKVNFIVILYSLNITSIIFWINEKLVVHFYFLQFNVFKSDWVHCEAFNLFLKTMAADYDVK